LATKVMSMCQPRPVRARETGRNGSSTDRR
jgi:hypothetical protein